MAIYESDVPGVGRKFELEIDGDERLVVLIHHDGKREVYRRPSPDADSTKLFSLSGKLSRQLGTILEGTYFQPIELDDAQVPLGEAIIEWTELSRSSPLVGRTLEETGVRGRTGVSIIAIQRNEETMANPNPGTRFAAGDIVVAIGTRDEHAKFGELAGGDE